MRVNTSSLASFDFSRLKKKFQGRPLRIALVAGEVSGDLLGAQLIRAIRSQFPDVEFMGIAGPQMHAQGCVAWFSIDELAVRGYVEVLRHLPRLLRLRRQLIRRLLVEQPDVYVGIDAPDFNLAVARRLKESGILTIHYVSPSIWAWRAQRLKKIERSVDHVLALFPFEPPLYRNTKVHCSYVGHPLADLISLEQSKEAVRAQFQLAAVPQIALLPGSRMDELIRHTQLFLVTAQRILNKLPNAHFLVPLATQETYAYFEQALYNSQIDRQHFRLLYGHAQSALQAADIGLIASGTAALEGALCRCPMVVTYRLHPLTYRWVRAKLYLPYISLPNVLVGDWLVPELLQEEATPENIAQVLINLYHDPVFRSSLGEVFREIHVILRQDSALKSAEVILQAVLEQSR